MVGMLWDLGVFSKTTDVEVSAKQAIKHSSVWFGIGLLMTVAVYFFTVRCIKLLRCRIYSVMQWNIT